MTSLVGLKKGLAEHAQERGVKFSYMPLFIKVSAHIIVSRSLCKFVGHIHEPNIVSF
jgi:pyruvate/2-oxoglutarate dehydrogenase complex dihydrolipoamide acyltransferase (E2) component